jgi:hypothetical protein
MTPEENKKIKLVTISTFDWSDYTEFGSYPDNLKPKFRKNSYDSVSGKAVERIKKYLKS